VPPANAASDCPIEQQISVFFPERSDAEVVHRRVREVFMPVTIKGLKQSDPDIIINDGDNPKEKLKDLLEAFVNLPKSGGKKDSPDQKGAFGNLKSSIIRAIQTASGTGDLIRDCWNLICKAYGDPSLKKNGIVKPKETDALRNWLAADYDLPIPAPPRTKVAPASIVKPPEDTEAFRNWKLANAAALNWFKLFEAGLTHEPASEKQLTEEEWGHIVDSVWLLGERYPAWLNFFRDIYNIALELQHHPRVALDITRLRVRGLLRQLVPKPAKGRKEKSIDGYKGACAELLDAFNTIMLRPDVTRIAIPTSNKQFEKEDVALYLQDSTLREQDIDRTEVYWGNIKLYVEVKSDVHTAVQKHKTDTAQLDRIVAVVNNRIRTRHGTLTRPKDKYERRVPAVSIVNPDGWLELFTSGTARNYIKLGFGLIIDGVVLGPDDLAKIDRKVWAAASGDKLYPVLLQKDDRELLERYFAAKKLTFPRPSDWRTI
jgi:hypothetical protein